MPDTRNPTSRTIGPRQARRVSGPVSHPGHELVEELLTAHSGRLVAVARRYSLCDDDANDAFQRAVEILLRRAPGLDPASAVAWMRTVVKHEAMAVRSERLRAVSREEPDHDSIESRGGIVPSSESLERLATAREAISRLKPHEAEALLLKAAGLSYSEIQQHKGWTYTKVNRLLTEGRAAFRSRVADIESGNECLRWAPTLALIANGSAEDEDLARVRPHLIGCRACRASLAAAGGSRRRLPAIFPVALLGLIPAAWQRMASTWQERVSDPLLAGAIRAQGAVEVAASTKALAAAASAAAIASGGVAVERVVTAHPAPVRAAPMTVAPQEGGSPEPSVSANTQVTPSSDPAPRPSPPTASAEAQSAPEFDPLSDAGAPKGEHAQVASRPATAAPSAPPAASAPDSQRAAAGGEFQP